MLSLTADVSEDKGGPLMTTAATFGRTQFGDASLGHKSRTECLVKIADLIHRHPGGTLPAKLHAPKDYKAMDRLMNRPEVTHQSVLASPCDRTRRSMREASGVTLVLHDTTELDYSGLRSIADLGSIGGDLNRGLLCHNSLAFDPGSGEVLGLANQILHRRVCRESRNAAKPKLEGVKQKRERDDRESRLWLRGVEAVGEAPAGKQWVHVADRGADGFEFLANLTRQKRAFLVRSCSDRVMLAGHGDGGPRTHVQTHARSLPRTGRRVVSVSARPGQPSRTAKLSVGFAPVTLVPPHVRRGEYQKEPLRLWVVCVREDDPPGDQTPLEWILLTSVEVACEEQAWERVDWYECRWVLEEYHKAMKTGCGVEELQFTSSQALEPMIGLLSVVAVTLLKLRDAARRPDATQRRARELVDPEYVRILSAWRTTKAMPDWSVHDFFMALARLGGHQNRKSDHRPGWLVLWRGWMALQHMLDGAAVKDRIRGQT
jgi:hypothetical protein